MTEAPPPFQHVIYNGKLMDEKTKAFIQAMEARLGYPLTIVQGCYSTAVDASAGTHAGGGVVDLAKYDWQRKVRVARALGAFAWHRPYNWDGRGGMEHIHLGIRDHGNLSPAAAAQQVQYDAHPPTNGLANRGLDETWHPQPPVVFHYPPKPTPVATVHQGVTLNDDWGNLASDVPGVVKTVEPLVMGVQEGFRVDYHKTVPKRWRVRQVEDNDSTAGVAVIWDTKYLKRLGRGGNPFRKGRGWKAMGQGADTRVRGVVWRDLEFRKHADRAGLPAQFRLASIHRDPKRDKADWPAEDAAVALWLRHSPLPVVLFMDSNEDGGPTGILTNIASKYVWHGVGIDGAVSALPINNAVALPKRSSDHHPIVLTFGTPTKETP
jgi:hypothetical protein